MSVVVVGSLHLDVMVAAPGLPRLGETMVGSSWSMKPGGKGGNQAVAAARNGARVAMVGLVGADDFGARLRANLRENGVDESRVAVCDAGSGMSVALSQPAGDYAAVIVSGANLRLDAAVLAPHAGILGAASWVLLQNEIPDAANALAASAARAGGARVLLNAAPARAADPALWRCVEVLVANAGEAEALCGLMVTGLAEAGRAAERLAETLPYAIVTAGGDGVALAHAGTATMLLPAHRVAVVSTHGAGDAFVGALAARLADGDTIDVALGYAHAAAALTVARDEAGRAAITAADIAALVERGP